MNVSCNIACAVWLAEAMLTDHYICALYLIEKENTSPANSFEPLVEETRGKFIPNLCRQHNIGYFFSG